MFITGIELEDIKSHKDSRFEFERGTTAIIGENGAGKTTLIEAIAWTMFDLLDYRKDAFLRRGAKKGVARVTFESDLDERTYLVHRDTATGYYVYDPAIKTRVADKKDEVLRFLRQHMGVEPGTDLESLFRSAIGVPQGTFTAIFLETPTERKRSFDKLLKVEEYRLSSDKLIDTVNHVKGLLTAAGNRISFAEGRLEGFDESTRSLKQLKEEERSLSASLTGLEKKKDKLRAAVEKFEKTEEELSGLRDELDSVAGSISKLEISIAGKEADRKSSADASEKVREFEAEHAEHIKALGMIRELERERGERERINKEVAEVEAAIVRVRSDQAKCNEDLERVLKARSRIEELKPKIEEEKKLESLRERLRGKLADAASAVSLLEKLEKDLADLRKRFKQVRSELEEAERKSAGAADLPRLVAEDDKLRVRLAELEGRLEIDRRFQSEVQNGLCPILSQKCLNLKEGETLEGFLASQFSELSESIRSAGEKRKQVAVSIDAARGAERFQVKLEPLRKRNREIQDQGRRLKEEKESLERLAAESGTLREQLKETETKLEQLGSPSANVRLLEAETGREIPLREMITKIESNLERLESERRLKTEHLESYKDLDFNWKLYTEIRDRTEKAHREFLANESAAKLLGSRDKELKTLREELSRLKKEKDSLDKKMSKAAKGFDREEFGARKSELVELERSAAASQANLENVAKRREESEVRVEELRKIRKQLAEDKKEKDRLDKLASTTAFIRATLKEAAPRVAKNYVYHVSIEANQMFREITGNVEQTLKWEEDYGIALDEGGFDRPFQNLSGGEQMAAALSVRLALLKQLSDISLAFFDEPTTNLDLERRERLAEQISRITESRAFEQLFVISHDDTFEGYVDNVITLESEGDR